MTRVRAVSGNALNRGQIVMRIDHEKFHDDGVVDDETDRQNETEEGEGVDGKAQHREEDECPHE
jgi:hypothetical protein